MCFFLFLFFLLSETRSQIRIQDNNKNNIDIDYEYCIIGGGPGGLQMGYFLESSNRNYIIYERSNIAGSFYQKYPRHRTLLSINKRFTGRSNKEFNLRHDWNSLLSNNLSLRFTSYSTEYFPSADDLVRYFNDYAVNFNLNIFYNHFVSSIKLINSSHSIIYFKLNIINEFNNKFERSCKYLLMGTGNSLPNIPDTVPGIELYSIGYEDMNISPSYYYNKTVAILGVGNSALEIADSIIDYTAYISLFGSAPPRLSFLTHYVGDIRAINSHFFDQYQLKSLDNIITVPFNNNFLNLTPCIYNYSNGFHIFNIPDSLNNTDKLPSGVVQCWDIVIRALGWIYDDSIFDNHLKQFLYIKRTATEHKQFLNISTEYQMHNIPNMYVIGELMHSRDYRKSAGGFIHGFRYLIKSLYHILEYKNHAHNISYSLFNYPGLISHIITRINEASAPYQMYTVIGDVIIFNNMYNYIQDILLDTLFIENNNNNYYGIQLNDFVTWTFQYGDNFTGCKVFGDDRVRSSEPYEDAHCSGFLHPVFKFYHNKKLIDEFHIIEDIATDWTKQWRHIEPLKQWFNRVIKKRNNADWTVHHLQECDNSKRSKRTKNKKIIKNNYNYIYPLLITLLITVGVNILLYYISK